MEIKTYNKQNIIQKQISSFMGLFKKDWNKINELKQNGLGVYTPKLNKVKVGLAVGVGVVAVVVPFTPDFLIIPFMIKWVLQ